jgi:hypothetical protein
MLSTGLTTLQHWTPIPSQVKSFHTLTPCLCINRLQITLQSPVISSPLVFRLIFYRYFWSVPTRATSTYYIILLNLMTLIISGKEYTSSRSFSNFSRPRMISLTLGPNRPNLLSTPTSNTHNFLLHQGRETKFHTHIKEVKS